ncbi:transposase [Xenorhabdus budapestensis]|uniref:Transposase n=1 Tax=Xenorhabdus budapestensis TaxID=290110 RepID=A0A2D0J3N9_XENBU|nr:transposase [Xenorhabdus budapestensis]
MFDLSTKAGEKIDEKQLQPLATKLAQNLKTPEVLSQLSIVLKNSPLIPSLGLN